ncbi:DNA mismatch repair protein MutL [Martensiomyces pterosporus]|nr:DNA mismatch repair protein MutL [Martensiomyces pterosporus]
MAAPIRKLDESVINRIAAGEIINRPSNALKELIENSLDAGATSISISVKDGGLKLLQIQDNGHGIRTEDLAVVCERFTTSKLRVYEDLSTIQTYGFRGEALASISHVSHLSITTKQADSECAYRAHYVDGRLAPPRPGASCDPEPCAGNNGTLIAAEDLFYSIPSRRSALKNTREEYNRIFDVASRYAIHNAGIAFTCRKTGTAKADLNTIAGATTVANIRQIFGSKVANSVVPVEHKDGDLEFEFKGYVSSATHEMHKSMFLLFINHRLVDHTPIKRATEALYASIFPKAARPFMYLDLRIKPENIDVNVHPTKREVRFLNEDSIVNAIVETIQKKLLDGNAARPNLAGGGSARKTPVNKAVRTNYKTLSLESFSFGASPSIKRSRVQTAIESDFSVSPTKTTQARAPLQPRVEVRLTSILSLRKDLQRHVHQELTKVLSEHTFVGFVDDRRALIQHQTRLYMIDYCKISYHIFYHRCLFDFMNYGRLVLQPAPSVYELAVVAASELGNESPERCANEVLRRFSDSREMLEEYFHIRISDIGTIETMPMIVRDYSPDFDKLPLFLYNATYFANWEEEQPFFKSFINALATLYTLEPPLRDDPQNVKDEYRLMVEHRVLPSLKGSAFWAPNSLLTENALVELVDLPDLYRIFERC